MCSSIKRSSLDETSQVALPSILDSSIASTPMVCTPVSEPLLQLNSQIKIARKDYHQGDLTAASDRLEQILSCLTQWSEQNCLELTAVQQAELCGAVYTLRGLVEQNRGCDEAAQQAFGQAVAAFDQYWAEAEDQATSQDFCDYCVSLDAVGRTTEAIALLQNALAQGLATPEIYAQLGALLIKQDCPDEAERMLLKGLKLSPDNVDCLQQLAQLLETQTRRQEAIQVYLDAVVALIRQNRLEMALQVADQAQKLEPQHPVLLSHRAELLTPLARHEEALHVLDQALNQDAENVSLLLSKGAVLTELNRAAEALNTLEQALQRSPNHAFALGYRGKALRLCHRWEEAIAAEHQAIAADPSLDWVYVELAESLYQSGHSEEALQIIDQALAIAPNNIDAWRSKGSILVSLNRCKEALPFLDRVLQQSSQDIFAIRLKAQVLCVTKVPQEAIAWIEPALSAHPQDALLLGCKGWMLVKQERSFDF